MEHETSEYKQTLAAENQYFTDVGLARERMREGRVLAGESLRGDVAANRGVARALAKQAAKSPEVSPASTLVASLRYIFEDSSYYIGPDSIFDANHNVLVIAQASKLATELGKSDMLNGAHASVKRQFYAVPDCNIISRFVDVDILLLREQVESRAQELVNDGLSTADASAAAQAELNASLIEALQAARGDTMQSHWETLQATQFHIIDLPLQTLMLLQGGPGTGKTLVALHRLQYLLYNFPEAIRRKVLFVGPSNEFYKYMLGAVATQRQDLFDYVIATDLTSFDVVVDPELDSAEVSALKGSRDMVDLLERALQQRRNVLAEDSPILKYVGYSDLTSMVRDYLDMPYSRGRLGLQNRLLGTPVVDAAGRASRIPPDVVEAFVQQIWPRLNSVDFLRTLFNSLERLLSAAPDGLSARDVRLLHRKMAPRISEQRWSHADLPLIDFVDGLLGENEPTKYAYIIVDEAQDLTPMQRYSISRRSATGAMMLLGDLAQASRPNGARTWEEVQDDLTRTNPEWKDQVIHRSLSLAFRTPGVILDLLNPLSAVLSPTSPELLAARPDDGVVEGWTVGAESGLFNAQATQDDLLDLADWLDADGGLNAPIEWALSLGGGEDATGRTRRVAIIVPDAILGATQVGLDGHFPGVRILTPDMAKGLEFDVVILVDPLRIASSSPRGLHELFIAASRATQALGLVYQEGEADWPDIEDAGALPSPPTHEEAAIPQPRGVLDADAVREKIAAEIADFLSSAAPPHARGRILHLAEQMLVARDSNA